MYAVPDVDYGVGVYDVDDKYDVTAAHGVYDVYDVYGVNDVSDVCL